MLSPDNRVCPGVGGRKCGMCMSPVSRDPYPTCSRCRGRKCSSDSPCSDCHDWSLEQWEIYNKRRSYAERNRPPSRHSGNPTVPNTITPCSPDSKSAASAPAPLPHSAPPPPPPSEGPVSGEETSSEDSKRTRVSFSSPLPLGEQGERGGGDTDKELAVDGRAFPLPLPLEEGRLEPPYPQPPPIVTKAQISPRPNSLISHPYPPHSGDWSERGENHIYCHPTAPTRLTSVGQKREMPGDRRTALDRQGYYGPPPMPTDRLRSRDNVQYLSARNPAAHSPAGSGSPVTRPQSPGYPWQPSQWPGADQAAYYQGAPRYQGEHTHSYENKQFPYPGTCQHGPRDSHHQAWQSYASPGTAYTSPWPSYGYQPSQPSPGHHCGARQQWDYTPTQPNWHGGSPQAQALAWEHANGSDCGPSNLPSAGNPSTAHSHQTSNSSPGEPVPRDRLHQGPLGVKRRAREATQSESKRRKVASPDQPQPATPLSPYSSDSEKTESQGTPPWEDDLVAHGEHSASASAAARTSTEATPSTSGMLPRSWTFSPRDHEGERPESLYSVDEERDDSFTSVLDSIRRVNNLEKPAGVTPSRGRTTVALRRGLQSEPSPVLHLPPSELLKALVGDVNSTLDKFVEEQTPNAFIPLQMKRQRRYYRTSEPVLSAPYTVSPGLVSLTLDKAAEPKKRPVTIPHSLVSFFKTALAGAGEAVSWLDGWLATISDLGDSQPEETRAEFQ